MAPKVLFVTRPSGPAGYLLSFDDQTSDLELVALKSDAATFPIDAAQNQRTAVMRALTPAGRHIALAVEIQDA